MVFYFSRGSHAVIIQERFYDILKDTVQRSGHEVVKDKQVADIYIGLRIKI